MSNLLATLPPCAFSRLGKPVALLRWTWPSVVDAIRRWTLESQRVDRAASQLPVFQSRR